jgi:UDP-N-acetylglucosamine transferase subunit ALG13
MIFVTVGTEEFSFDRFVKAIDEGVGTGIIKEKVLAQIGNSSFTPRNIQFIRYLPFQDLMGSMRKSNIIITHAGVGSTLLCYTLGKIPILFPRYAENGEHIDDHQVDFAKRLERDDEVLVAYTAEDLLYKINNYAKLVSKCRSSKKNASKSEIFLYLDNIIERNE